ncbi:huntingtin-interacting protein 1-like isoform X3 [Saccostrea cucullata]|uniref:huntingtin-interacting protein 1-like isoform X3 n=1 Tax=Saccostrea cuccullata TaxID=36930 RepID=UPI002ED234C4
MSTRQHLPRGIGNRSKTATDVERENFEKSQTVAINKAINNQESPVKEKHVRIAILGTFTENGASMFWHIATKLPVQGNPIVCWKFCHVVHKLLREGHPNVVVDSFKYCSHLKDLGKLWGHLREGYGKSIENYCRLLIQKLQFHKKNMEIPGNLKMSDEQFAKICGSDVNNYFEITVDMLDYMDEILALQHSVFSSLDMSRSNSMTNAGQCRLAPLILCIQDSCQLYDYIVKSLFRLHSSLPPDTLSGHRDRFMTAYQKLKQFYLSSSNLQYFKNLVQVPFLPEEPPNFLIASDFSKHVKPVAVVPEPEPENEPDTDSIGDLIDTSEDKFDAAFGNGFEPPEIDERDLLIERLQKEIQFLKSEIERIKFEDARIIAAQKEEIAKLEKILSELRLSADKAMKETESTRIKLEEATVNAGAMAKLAEAEKHAKANDEKFKKMKDIYNKLREEHVALIRKNADTAKKLEVEKRLVQEKDQTIQSPPSVDCDQLHILHLENQVKTLGDTKANLMSQLQSSEEECESLQARLEALEKEKHQSEDALQLEIRNVQGQLASLKDEMTTTEIKRKNEIDSLKNQLENTLSEKKEMETQLKECIEDLQRRLNQLDTDKQAGEKRLQDNLSQLHKDLIASAVNEGRKFISDAMQQVENPTHIPVRCTAEFLLLRAEPVLSSLENLKTAQNVYTQNQTDLEALLTTITNFSHNMSDCVINGIATSHSAQLEAAEDLMSACLSAGESGLEVLNSVSKGGSIQSEVEKSTDKVKQLIKLAEDLVPKMVDVKEQEIGDLVENEMNSTHVVLEQAAKKIEEMLHQTRKDMSGVELTVNESILDSCTGLMKAIKVLLVKSQDLQKEIVAQGRGTSSVKEFYKKNHRWTEGLLSAAKAVGWGATSLLDAADKVVKGEGKFEELIVCSNEIAASTAQLVVASKVKADRKSKKLSELSEASKGVSSCTGKVVGSAREAAQIIEEQSLMDFTKLNLMQAKKEEMQSQVRVLELEKELETERYKLGQVRKRHYQLAGESEGWETNELTSTELGELI